MRAFDESRGLNRNLEQREVMGSMILFDGSACACTSCDLTSVPGHIVANEAEASDFRMRLHDAPKGGLSILGHAVGFI